MKDDCIFCQIVNKQKPADFIYEDEEVVAFKDINPKAKIHILIVPKKHIESVIKLEKSDKDLVGQLVLAAKRIAEIKGIHKTGYKLVFNCGRGGGQIIDHIHLHLLGEA